MKSLEELEIYQLSMQIGDAKFGLRLMAGIILQKIRLEVNGQGR